MAAPAGDLSRLLRPRSIAVFGGKEAGEVVRQCERMGFSGAIWPVHPERDEVAGRPAYRSVAELPAAPDAAFLAVNRHATIELIGALAGRGAGGAVCYASGFAEAGVDGTALQERLVAAAAGMPILGPNCYGFINYLDDVALWPDQHGGRHVERGVAIVTQSGNIGLNLTMQRRGLPIAYLATLGNQAAIGLSATIEALVADPRVTAIGLHIEGLDDPRAFAEAAEAARRRNLPIVALKTGRSQQGARLAISHTASLAGADAVVDAFLRRAGIVRVAALPVLLESLKLLHLHGPLPGRDIASMSCSGGEAALIADAASATALSFRPLSEPEAARIAATLPELVAISNPLDYHTFSWAKEAALTETFAAMMAAGFDLTMLILDFPRRDRCDDADWDCARRALAAAARRVGGRAAIVASLPELLPEAQAEQLMEAGIAPLLGIAEALAAIAAAAAAGDFVASPQPAPLSAALPAGGATVALSEWEGKQCLAAHGVSIPAGRLAASEDEAVAAAAALGFPVALKAVGRAIAHKSEIGAVRLALPDEAAVAAAARALRPLGEALLVERMVADGVAELIVGVDRDPQFGHYLVIGSGGVLVELVGDRRLLLMPATSAEIEQAIASLKSAALLAGHRGKPKGDLAAAVAAVLAIQRFVLANAARVVELEANPLIVRPAGRGAVAADVLMRLAEENDRD